MDIKTKKGKRIGVINLVTNFFFKMKRIWIVYHFILIRIWNSMKFYEYAIIMTFYLLTD